MSEIAHGLARVSAVGGARSPRKAGSAHDGIRGLRASRLQLKWLSGAIPPDTKTTRCLRWLAAVTGLVLLPKCFACVAGYLAVLAGLSAATPELCGNGEAGAPGWVGYLFAGGSVTVVAGISLWLIERNRAPVSKSDGHER